MSAVIVPFPRDRIFRDKDLCRHIEWVYRHFRKTSKKDSPAENFRDAVEYHYHFPRKQR